MAVRSSLVETVGVICGDCDRPVNVLHQEFDVLTNELQVVLERLPRRFVVDVSVSHPVPDTSHALTGLVRIDAAGDLDFASDCGEVWLHVVDDHPFGVTVSPRTDRLVRDLPRRNRSLLVVPTLTPPSTSR